MKSERAWLKR
jgi:hypothetical protein